MILPVFSEPIKLRNEKNNNIQTLRQSFGLAGYRIDLFSSLPHSWHSQQPYVINKRYGKIHIGKFQISQVGLDFIPMRFSIVYQGDWQLCDLLRNYLNRTPIDIRHLAAPNICQRNPGFYSAE